MTADHFIRDATGAISVPWSGTANQQGLILVAFIILVLLVARVVAWIRQGTAPNSN